MAIEETHRSYDDLIQELEPEERFRVTLRDLCGLFVVIIDAKIYLLHQTAKEFLVQDNSLASDRVKSEIRCYGKGASKFRRPSTDNSIGMLLIVLLHLSIRMISIPLGTTNTLASPFMRHG